MIEGKVHLNIDFANFYESILVFFRLRSDQLHSAVIGKKISVCVLVTTKSATFCNA